MSSGALQAYILGPPLFLIYIDDMLQTAKYNLFFYADDTFLVSQHKDINEIKRQPNEDFEGIRDCFVHN